MIAILAGPLADPQFLSKRVQTFAAHSPLIIGVDGGVAPLSQLGITIHLRVGDWDSLGTVPSEPRVDLKKDKDQSDFAVALAEASARGATKIVCIGFQNGRFDHFLSNIFESFRLLERLPAAGSICFESEEESDYLLDSRHPLWKKSLPSKTLASIFSFSEKTKIEEMSGFQYEMKDEWLEPSSRGLSNQNIGQHSTIKISSGKLLIHILDQSTQV